MIALQSRPCSTSPQMQVHRIQSQEMPSDQIGGGPIHLVPTIETDHPLILGKQPRSEYFHYATKHYGGLLDLARCDFASQADFSLATHRIKRSLDFWLERNDVCSKFLGDLTYRL